MGRSIPIVPSATPLTDGAIVVRPRRADDLDAIAAASHDPDTLRWLDDPPMDAEARHQDRAAPGRRGAYDHGVRPVATRSRRA
ncbi:hypothetical protein WEI85_40160 [Actinomycetes bacterium KLBMP 9797]